MEYIAYKDYNGTMGIEDPIEVTIHVGDTFECTPEGLIIDTKTNQKMCFAYSFNGHRHFVRNDDGNGLLRGKLISAILFDKRPNRDKQLRWSDEEVKLLETKYVHYLKDCGAIYFDRNFFTADIDTLKEMAKDLNIEY